MYPAINTKHIYRIVNLYICSPRHIIITFMLISSAKFIALITCIDEHVNKRISMSLTCSDFLIATQSDAQTKVWHKFYYYEQNAKHYWKSVILTCVDVNNISCTLKISPFKFKSPRNLSLNIRHGFQITSYLLGLANI